MVGTAIVRMRAVALALATGAPLLCLAACEEGVAEGASCEVAQDCEGTLVCAKVSEDADQRVCAPVDDTVPERSCNRDYANMVCGVVLKPDAGG